MKKSSVIVYSIFAVVMYVFAIAYFAFNLCLEYNTGDTRTKRRFDHTAITIQENMKKIHSESYNASQIKDIITRSFGNMDDFAYIEFFENGYTVYSYKTNTLTENNSTKLIKNYTSNFNIDDNNYFFTANLYTLKPTSIFKNAKIAFLIILIITIATFILIIISNLNTIKEEKVIEDSSETVEEETETTPLTEINQEEISNTQEPSLEENSDTKQEEKEPKEIEDEISEEEPELDVIETEITQDTKEEEQHQNIPEGIFSPETGLSYEPFLLTKLGNEINRAIASEADLSVFVICLPGLERTSNKLKEISNYLAIQFQYKELLFEYKADSIAAIKVNSTIDESITFADKIYENIKSILDSEESECYIGITSRTIRMVSADRMLMEADEAIVHAKEEKDSPIIAFRADAEKFRLMNN